MTKTAINALVYAFCYANNFSHIYAWFNFGCCFLLQTELQFKTFISCPILSERPSAVYQNLGWPFSNNINSLFSDSPIAGTVLKLY